MNDLIQARDGYRRLLEESGSLPHAAYRLAKAKCQTWEHATDVPTRIEVRAAAREIARQVPGTAVPETRTLLRDCEALGLSVL
ncbi:MAG TPA: hypothetical protein RMH99_18465 [Sandaracinaceae bacterium LLY-WYZ-13_1]|nr:hypothetical protein [Sandaracinaceae bacterium LLY-WYZ-13_1]